jgi:hypothetical protein
MVLAINHPAPLFVLRLFRLDHFMERWRIGRLVPRLFIPGTYARPYVPQVWFYHGIHRSFARITWDDRIL